MKGVNLLQNYAGYKTTENKIEDRQVSSTHTYWLNFSPPNVPIKFALNYFILNFCLISFSYRQRKSFNRRCGCLFNKQTTAEFYAISFKLYLLESHCSIQYTINKVSIVPQLMLIFYYMYICNTLFLFNKIICCIS